MSGTTTNPNGSRELNVKREENQEEIEKFIREAGYNDMKVNLIAEVQVSNRVISENNATSSATAATSKHVKTGENATVAFVGKIPDIAQGPKAPLKESKDKKHGRQPKDKEKKDTSYEDRGNE